MDWRVVRHAAVNQASHRLLIGDDAGGRSSGGRIPGESLPERDVVVVVLV